MRRFLNKLFRDFRTTGSSGDSRRTPYSTALQVEGLEDRMVLSSASLGGANLSVLNIGLSPGASIELTEINTNGNRQIAITGSLNKEFSINPLKDVDISLSGNDSIFINDSGGMPFATGTLITLSGNGSNNLLDLNGIHAFDTGEQYVPGGAASTLSTLKEDGLEFLFTNALQTVKDTIQLTGGPLDVTTTGQNVVLTSGDGDQTLSGLGSAGGSTFIYADKSVVDLNESAASATVNLDASSAAELETGFSVITHAQGDSVVIGATGGPTSVQTIGSDSEVFLQTNLSPVSVEGNISSKLIIGKLQSNGGFTNGIQANVNVQDMGLLIIANNGNVTTNEKVTVTENTISGTGLFGNNAAVVSYGNGNVATVDIDSGELEDSYTVETSSSIPVFDSRIDLVDDSSLSFSAHVNLNAHSHLNLELTNLTKKPGELFIDAPGGKYSNKPNGVINVFNSQIDFQGFTVEEEHS